MSFGSENPAGHFGSVDSSPGGTPSSGITTLTSTGGTVTITNPTGPVANLEVAAGTPFPGYSPTAPPAVALASALGVSALAARGDHTHKQDLSIVYAPSLAAGQASGVFQQTYAAPNATPSVLNVGTNLIPFGAAAGTGLLSTSPSIFGGQLRLGTISSIAVANPAGTVTAANLLTAPFSLMGQLLSIDETYSTQRGFQNILNSTAGDNSSGAGPQMRFSRSQGTYAAPTVVTGTSVGTSGLGLMQITARGYDGTAYIPAGNFIMRADTIAGAGGLMTAVAQMTLSSTSNLQNNFDFLWTSSRDFGVDRALSGTTATAGFLWLAGSGGAPTGVPSIAKYSITNGSTAVAPDTTNQRWYAYVNAGWHYAQLMDYDPGANPGRLPFVGATNHTLTDSANFSYATATGRLTLAPFATGSGGSSISLGAGPAGSGIAIGGSSFVALNVTDTLAGGQASIAVDDYYFGQALIGYGNSSLQPLRIGSGGAGNVLQLQYAMNRTGAGTDAVTIDGVSGAVAVLKSFTQSGGDVSITGSTFANIAVTAGASVLMSTGVDIAGAAGGTALSVGPTGLLALNNPMTLSGTIQMGAGNVAANGAVATVLGALGPAGSHTTVQEWLIFKGTGGANRWVAGF